MGNVENIELVRNRLMQLAVKYSVIPHRGICDNVTLSSKLHQKVWLTFCTKGHWEKCLNTWKHYSGNPAYPIKGYFWHPSPSIYFSDLANNGKLWKGRAGKRRTQLCEHTIAYIEKHLM